MAQLPARARERRRAGRCRGPAEQSRTRASGQALRCRTGRPGADVAVLGPQRRQAVRAGRDTGGGVADRRRGGRAGGVRLPPVHRPAHRDGRAGGAVRGALGAGVHPARQVAPGRGRRPAAGTSERAGCAGSGRRAAAMGQSGAAGSTGRSGAGAGVRAGACGGGPVVGAGPYLGAGDHLAAAPAPGRRRQRRDAAGLVADRGTGHGRLPRSGGRRRRAAGPDHGRTGVAGKRGDAASGSGRGRPVLPTAGRAGGPGLAGAAGGDRLRRPAAAAGRRGGGTIRGI
jgi:hypothetical protein